MTAEMSHGQSEQPLPPNLRLVREDTESDIAAAETSGKLTILDGFKNFFKKEHGVSLWEVTPRDVPLITLGAHAYIHGVVTSRYSKLEQAGRTPDFLPTPDGTIDGIIKQYYKDYGLTRWTGGNRLFREKQFISDNTAEVEEAIKPGQQRASVRSKYARFPEISLSIELHRVLKATHNDLPADAVEVLKASYGQRFRDIGGTALRESLENRATEYDYEEALERYRSVDADEMWD